MALRGKDEVRELMGEAGIELSGEDFEKVFAMASEADEEQGQCCLVSDANMLSFRSIQASVMIHFFR